MAPSKSANDSRAKCPVCQARVGEGKFDPWRSLQTYVPNPEFQNPERAERARKLRRANGQ